MCKKDNRFGFKTRKLWVLKAERKDADEIAKFYAGFGLKRQKEIAQNWKKMIEDRGDDCCKEVAMIVRDKCKKAIGLVETVSQDGERVGISIWIPNPIKKVNYQKALIDSMIEWCEDYSDYEVISVITSITGVTSFGVEYEEIMRNISCAS